MNDPIEKLCVDNIRFFDGECAKLIARIERQKRRRLIAAASWSGMLLILAGWDFYRLRYWGGVFDSFEALFLATFNWKIWSVGIDSGRYLKKLAAAHKLAIQKDLDAYRNERGF